MGSSYYYAMGLLSLIFDEKTAVIGVIIGLFNCFLGFKLSKLCMCLGGFLTGIFIGAVIAIKNGNENYMVMGFFIAIILAAVSYNFYKLGAAIVAFINTGLSVFFMRLLTGEINMTKADIKSAFMICCIVGTIAAILTFIFTKPMFIISTSISGGYIAGLFLGIIMNNFTVSKIFAIIFMALGIFVQIKTNSGLFENKPHKTTERLEY